MKNHSKFLLLVAITASLYSSAQMKLPVSSNDLRNNLEKIISDFPYNFSSLKGDTLMENPQTIEFAALIDCKTAPVNSIIQYKSAKPVYSWTATLIETEEFEEAAKKYTWLCNQLRVMSLSFQGGYSYTLNGLIEAPTETRKFSSSIFTLMPRANDLPKIRIEATMNFEFPEWKVGLMVYDRERQDDERGAAKGD